MKDNYGINRLGGWLQLITILLFAEPTNMASVNGHSQIDEQLEMTLTHSNSCLSVHHAQEPQKEPQKEPQILTLYPHKEPQKESEKEPQILTLYPTNTESDAPNSHRLNTPLSSGWEYNSKRVRQLFKVAEYHAIYINFRKLVKAKYVVLTSKLVG